MPSGKVLFVCVHNAGRSQMAAAFAREAGIDAESAGTVPAEGINPTVVAAMKESGIDLSTRRPKMLTSEMIAAASAVVTMGCSVEEACPKPMLAKLQKKLIEWNIEDPKGKDISRVREIRDEVQRQVAALKLPS